MPTDDMTLAKKVQRYYADNPADTISEVADAMSEDPERIKFVLDEFRVQDNEIEHVGPGMGGGWVSATT